MTALQQTQGEILRIFVDWKNLYAPKNLIENDQTASLLVDYVIKHHGGLVSFTALNAAVTALADQVLKPEPKPLTLDELAAIENTRMHADYMKSIAPQESFDAKVARDKQKRQAEAASKAQADAKGELARAISGYECYRENGAGVDYTATEMVQRELALVKFGNDMVRTLAVVRRIIQDLPDHPKMGDVARVVEKLNRELK